MYKKKICSVCNEETYLFSRGRCKSCSQKSYGQSLSKDRGAKGKVLSKKPRKPTGEAEIFKIIWEEREHICENCCIYLGEEARAHFFSHIISKGKEPKLRLVKSNLMLLCFDCHYLFDHGTKDKYNERKNLYFGKYNI